MVEFNFYLTNEDVDRLFYLKHKDGKNNLTGNEYAKELLHILLYGKCPRVPKRDEDGDYIEED